MLNITKHWLAPPVFPNDDEQTRRAGLLNSILLIAITLPVAFILIDLFTAPSLAAIDAVDAVFVLGCLALRYDLRRGRVQRVGRAMMALGLVIIGSASTLIGMFQGPIAGALIMLVTLSGLLLSRHGVSVMILCASLLAVGFGLYEAAPPVQIMMYCAIIGISGQLTYFSMQSSQHALQHERDFAITVLNTMAQGVAVMDSETRFEYVNEACARALGYTPSEMIGLKSRDMVYPDDRHMLERAYVERTLGQTSVYEVRYARKDGSPVPLEVRGIPRVLDGVHKGSIVVVTDLTERKQAEADLSKQRDFALMVVNTMGEGLLVTDEAGHVEFINPAASRILGREPREVIGRMPEFLVVPDDRSVLAAGRRMRQSGHSGVYELRVARPDGDVVPVQITSVAREPHGGSAGAIAVMTDLTERKRTEEQLLYISTHDALTGVYNRAFWQAEMQRLEASREYPISILVADLDNMKTTNDRHGHAAGDELLQRAVHALQSVFRASDILARMGGDEFVLVLPKTDEMAGAAVMQRIRDSVANANRVHGDLPLSLSLGMATAEHGRLAETLRLADARMYENKRARKEGRIA